MTEYGKSMLLVNLLRYIRQFTQDQSENVSYFSWQEGITEIGWATEVDVELPIAKDGSDIAALCNWSEANSEATLLVLTDGYFKLNVQQRHQLSQFDNLYLVSVGGDADLVQLNTLSNHSFRAEELDRALHTIYRPKAVGVAPLHRFDLTKIIIENESENDDEW